MKDNEDIEEAIVTVHKMTEDEKMRRLADLREKAILDEKEAEYTGYCKGEEAGLKKGRIEGREMGIKDATKNIARNMKEKGIDIKTIMEVTNLSKQDIEELN